VRILQEFDVTLPPVSRLRASAFVVLAALALWGCGRRGALEPPPDPSALAKEAEPDDPTRPHPRHKPKPIEKPKTPFVLDPLL
jgi:predicted small lipoprotein YifL